MINIQPEKTYGFWSVTVRYQSNFWLHFRAFCIFLIVGTNSDWQGVTRTIVGIVDFTYRRNILASRPQGMNRLAFLVKFRLIGNSVFHALGV